MDHPTVYVGLDYHKNSIQVCVLDQDGKILANQRCDNRWQDVNRCVQRHGRVSRVAIEACVGAADLAEELVTRLGWSVELAHPGYVHRMKGNPDKTDFSDARMLADLTRVGYLPRVWLAPESIRELRRLVRYRQQLVDERRATKLRIRALIRDHRIREIPGKPWTKVWMEWLKQRDELGEQSRWLMDCHLSRLQELFRTIAATERRLNKVTRHDEMVIDLMDQSGIGPVTAWMIRAEIGRFDRFNSGKQVARFCGLSPRNDSSGERQADAGPIKAGNKQLRSTLIEAAWRLMRHDERWRALAEKMIRQGKPKCLVAAAIANRWIRKLYHEMKPLGLAA